MRALFVILFLTLPLAAQTRSELDSKYGSIENGRYRIRAGVAVEVKFSEEGKVKTFRILPDNPKALLAVEDVRKVIRDLVPGRLCHRPHTTKQLEVPCPPWKGCRGVQEEWKRATSLMVWFKDQVVYNLITLTEEAIPPPGSIKLLPGYEHVPGCGIDTSAGYIKKTGGIEIYYDIGRMAGNFAMRYANSEVAEWTRTEQVGNDLALIVRTKQNRIVATFEKAGANFSANVSSQADVDDFLKMVLTYISAAK